MANPLQAHYSFTTSYWFTEDEILWIRVVPVAYFFVIAGVIAVFFFVFTGSFGGLEAGAVSWAILTLVSKRSRRGLAGASVDALADERGLHRILLSDVGQMTLKGREVRFLFGGKRYRASMSEADRSQFEALLSMHAKQLALTTVVAPKPEAVARRSKNLTWIIAVALYGILMGWLGLVAFSFGAFTGPAGLWFGGSDLAVASFFNAVIFIGAVKPVLMSPLPRWFAFVALAFLNLSTVFDLVGGSYFFAFDLALKTLGILLPAAILGRVAYHRLADDLGVE
ncbi:MAG: hypothetical protein JRN21_02510 [Nitrososphaerota archaeon]|nr:hypothetical protein [Nitrososphaerota archaeon]